MIRHPLHKRKKIKPVCLEVRMKFNLENFTVLSMLNHWKLEIKKKKKNWKVNYLNENNFFSKIAPSITAEKPRNYLKKLRLDLYKNIHFENTNFRKIYLYCCTKTKLKNWLFISLYIYIYISWIIWKNYFYSL